jgi:hypothetical protein
MIKEQIIAHIVNCPEHEIDNLATFIAGMEAQKRALTKKSLEQAQEAMRRQYGIPQTTGEARSDREQPAKPGKSA